MSGCLLLGYFFFGPETMWNPPERIELRPSNSFKRNYLSFRRAGKQSFQMNELYNPVRLIALPSIILPAWSHANVFTLASVMLTVEIPELFQPRFHLSTQNLGLQFAAVIVG